MENKGNVHTSREERGREIIEIAEFMFQNDGFADTSMRHIAEKAGVAVGTLYNYFKSKYEILTHIVFGKVRNELKVAMDCLEEHEDPAEAVYCYVKMFIDSLYNSDRKMLAAFMKRSLPRIDDFESIWELTEIILDANRQVLMKYVAGDHRCINEAAYLLMYAMRLEIARRLMYKEYLKDGFSLEEAVRVIVRGFESHV